MNLTHPSGIAGANEQLAAMGVRARIAVQTKTPPKLVCPGGTAPTITFDPASIPDSQELVIAAGQPSPSDGAALNAGSNGSGDKGPGPASGNGNLLFADCAPADPPAACKIAAYDLTGAEMCAAVEYRLERTRSERAAPVLSASSSDCC